MWWNATTKYISLRTSNDEIKVDDETNAPLPQLRRENIIRTRAIWVAHVVLLLISSTLFYKASKLNRMINSSTGPPVAQEYGPAVDAVGKRYPQTFSGGFFDQSVYRGTPNPELDAAWEYITTRGAMAIPRKEMMRMEKLVPSSVQLTEEKEESYQGALEVFHHLHCLDTIRKMTYFEYYLEKDREAFSAPVIRTHTDHCIDMLRQLLMCNADLHVTTANWIDRVDHAWPDFSTTEMCRNFDDVREWGINHFAHTEKGGEDGTMMRPENASMLHLEIPEVEAERLGLKKATE